MLGALIREVNIDGNIKYIVEKVCDVSSLMSLMDIKRLMNYSYAMLVNSDVKPDMIYDNDIIYDKMGNQVYPSISSEEEIKRLKSIIAELTYNVDVTALPLEDLKDYLIRKNKVNLVQYLETHPMVYNEKTYTITEDKQNQLTGVLNAYNYAKAIGIDIPLTWNETGGECKPYAFEELVALYLQMLSVVKPLVTYQQHTETEIKNSTTIEELLNIDITFDNYGKEPVIDPVELDVTEETTPDTDEEEVVTPPVIEPETPTENEEVITDETETPTTETTETV